MTDTTLATLLAENAIRRLISCYCDAVCRRDADAAGILFAPDCRVRIAGGPERTGRDVQIEGMRQTFAKFSLLHQKCDTGMIDVEGDRARARLPVFEANRKHGTNEISLIFGYYEDEYVRLAEGWRFHRRYFTLEMRALLPVAKLQELPVQLPGFSFSP